jgi:hypothetical protein
MALELNGTTGVNLVQDGTVTAADLASTLDLTGKTVTLPAGVGGKVLQVVQKQNFGYANTGTTTSSSTFVDMLNMVATITPSSTSSKILIQSVGGGLFSASAHSVGLRLLANGSPVWTQERFAYMTGSNWSPMNFSTTTLDSPATTSAITYKFQFNVSGGSGGEVRIGDYGSTASQTYSAVILMEIAG